VQIRLGGKLLRLDAFSVAPASCQSPPTDLSELFLLATLFCSEAFKATKGHNRHRRGTLPLGGPARAPLFWRAAAGHLNNGASALIGRNSHQGWCAFAIDH
jgi:hypothetical protein